MASRPESVAVSLPKGVAEQSWPINEMPTPEQWRDWFVACHPIAQAEIARMILHDVHVANACIVQDHEGLGYQVRQLRDCSLCQQPVAQHTVATRKVGPFEIRPVGWNCPGRTTTT